MLAAFIDESYPEDRTRFVTCALVASFEQYLELSHELTVLKKRFAADYGLNPHIEFHGHEIWHRKKDWEPIANRRRARGKVFGAVFDAIATSGVSIYLEGIDNVAVGRRYTHPLPAHALSFSHLLERLDEHGLRENHHVMVICDHVDPALQQNHALETYRAEGTYGYKSRHLTRIQGELRYVDSTDQLALQAADMVAFLWNRRYTEKATAGYSELPHQSLWRRLAPAIRKDRIWP